MTRSSRSSYDEDFFAGTQDLAAMLRRMQDGGLAAGFGGWAAGGETRP